MLVVAALGVGEPQALLVTPFMAVHPQQGPSSGESKVGKYLQCSPYWSCCCAGLLALLGALAVGCLLWWSSWQEVLDMWGSLGSSLCMSLGVSAFPVLP